MARSFDYPAPIIEGWDRGTAICPHCQHEIQVGESVHHWQDALWHTKPCPSTLSD